VDDGALGPEQQVSLAEVVVGEHRVPGEEIFSAVWCIVTSITSGGSIFGDR
jgi:hypothetical protein